MTFRVWFINYFGSPGFYNIEYPKEASEITHLEIDGEKFKLVRESVKERTK
jgi:hypothetical protein